MTDPVIAVTAHCPRCGEQLVGNTFVTYAAVYSDSVVMEVAKVYIDHKCRPPQDQK